MDWPRLLSVERRRQTTRPQDPRREFERDFDRAVFSTPVKRLQGKAQVFPLDPNDTIRTRLTHSLEVSSVARGLAGRIAEWLHGTGQIEPEMIRSIEAIAATCGLVHDLGNPPFGHAGENAIRSWFQQECGKELVATLRDKKEQFGQDFLKFEGNAQSLRLVATLHVLADYKGLNFTFGTLTERGERTPTIPLSGNQVISRPRVASSTISGRLPETGKRDIRSAFLLRRQTTSCTFRRTLRTGSGRV